MIDPVVLAQSQAQKFAGGEVCPKCLAESPSRHWRNDSAGEFIVLKCGACGYGSGDEWLRKPADST